MPNCLYRLTESCTPSNKPSHIFSCSWSSPALIPVFSSFPLHITKTSPSMQHACLYRHLKRAGIMLWSSFSPTVAVLPWISISNLWTLNSCQGQLASLHLQSPSTTRWHFPLWTTNPEPIDALVANGWLHVIRTCQVFLWGSYICKWWVGWGLFAKTSLLRAPYTRTVSS